MDTKIQSAGFKKELVGIYGEKMATYQQTRYGQLVKKFQEMFGETECSLFSTSGRSEIIGNHTDHNHGCVLAAGINLDTIAAVTPTGDGRVRMFSEGYKNETTLDIHDLEIHFQEKGTTASLIRGIAARMEELGYTVGGFNAYVTSDVLRGSGLSSSAAIEVLVCTIFSHLYNEGRLDMVEAAKISQWAENFYFGKPCGLMDQTACALGNLVHIDFMQPSQPVVETVKYDFAAKGYAIVITDVRADHTDLTDEYAAITQEMSAVAEFFGVEKLRDVNERVFYNQMNILRNKVSDRAILRAVHFFEENKRVEAAVEAIKGDKLQDFFHAIIASGESSWKLLQNTHIGGAVSQPLTLALAMSEKLLAGKGAWRVHGGGFGGTILAFVPQADKNQYMNQMNALFGQNACIELAIRPCGSVKLEY